MFHVEPRRAAIAQSFTWNIQYLAYAATQHTDLGINCETIRGPVGRTPMISLARYTTLLAHRDFKSVLVASIVGRLPIGVTGSRFFFLRKGRPDRLFAAGARPPPTSSAWPASHHSLGRIIDRSGPRAVLVWCAWAFPASLVALVAAVHLDPASALLALACAFAAGANFPPITVCMRTFFRRGLAEESLLATAYSLEAVLIETIFIAGRYWWPFFVAYASASAAVLFAALCGIARHVAFPSFAGVAYLANRNARARHALRPARGARLSAFVPRCPRVSGSFGLVEIGVTAYAAELEIQR
jgi:hypothetical protein